MGNLPELVKNFERANAAVSSATSAVKGQLDNMDATAKNYQELIEAANRQIDELGEQMEALARQKETLETQIEEAQYSMMYGYDDPVKYALNRERAQAQIRALEARLADTGRQITDMGNRKRELADQIAALKSAKEKLYRAAAELQSHLEKNLRMIENWNEGVAATDSAYSRHLAGNARDIARLIDSLQRIRDGIEGVSTIYGGSVLSAREVAGKSIDAALSAAVTFGEHGLYEWLWAGIRADAALAGDPVDTTTGNFVYTAADLSIPGRHPLTFTRTYNSKCGVEGTLGLKWNHGYATRMHDCGTHIDVVFGDGHLERHTKLRDGFYMSPTGRNSSLIATGDKDGPYRLTTHTMESHCFDAAGQLTRVTDPAGNSTNMKYCEKGLLKEISNGCGSLFLGYDENGFLTSVADHAGRKTEYAYTENLLTCVKGPMGGTWRYGYGGNGLLTAVIGPTGNPELSNRYDERERVAGQTAADGSAVRFVYGDADRTTRYTAPDGTETVYRRDANNRTVGIGRGDCRESYAYDGAGNCTSWSDANGNTWHYVYDSCGNMVKAADPEGGVTAIVYNGLGQPVSITLPRGGELAIRYDGKGNITEITDPTGKSVTYTYHGNDRAGLIKTVKYPDGRITGFRYDGRGNIAVQTDIAGGETVYGYDSLNRPTSETDAYGKTTLYGYDAENNTVKTVYPDGGTVEYGYDLKGRVVSVTETAAEAGAQGTGGAAPQKTVTLYTYDAMGRNETVNSNVYGETRYGYDITGNMTVITGPDGSVTEYAYDRHGRLTKATDAEGATVEFGYDKAGNVTSVTSPGGHVARLEYDGTNRIKSVTGPEGATNAYRHDPDGNPCAVTDALGNTTRLEHDLKGRPTKHIDPAGNETLFAYSATGRIESVTDASGGKTTRTFGPGGRVETITMPCGIRESYGYDGYGNMTGVVDAEGNATTLAYDGKGRLLAVTDALGSMKKMGYDREGNVKEATDANGNTTEYAYTVRGELSEVRDSSGGVIRYRYDLAGRVTGAGHEAGAKTRTMAYVRNGRGDIVEETNPEGVTVKYGYDRCGNVTSRTDEEGRVTRYEYTGENRPRKVTYPDGRTVEMEYGATGYLAEMRDWLGTTKIETDPAGRPLKVTDHDGRVTVYRWNKTGWLELLQYPDGTEVSYVHDASGRILETTTRKGGNRPADTARFGYDRVGRLAWRELPDGTKTEYGYDGAGRLAVLVSTKDGTTLDRYGYTYDPAGNMVGMRKNRKGAESDSGTYTYAYDCMNRLVEAAHTGEGGKVSVRSYRYDGFGSRTGSTCGGTVTEYVMNPRNQVEEKKAAGVDGSPGSVVKYTYDKRGNLESETENGQLTATYAYDSANRLASVTAGDGTVTVYTYNGFGHRVGEKESRTGRETTYVYDITRAYGNLLMTGGTRNQSYTWGNGLLTGYAGEAKCHYLNDHLGTPARLMYGEQDPAGQEAVYGIPLTFDEYGIQTGGHAQNPWGGCGPADGDAGQPQAYANPFGFAGYRYESGGTYHAGARQYSPVLGRFMSEDPAKSGTNLYAYCGNRPLTMVDPEGLRHFPANLYAGGGIECSMAHTFMPASVFSAANGITFRVGPLPDEPVRGSMQTGEFRHGEVRVWVSGMPAGANGEAMVDREVLRTLSLNGHMNALIHYIDYHGTGWPTCDGSATGGPQNRWQPRYTRRYDAPLSNPYLLNIIIDQFEVHQRYMPGGGLFRCNSFVEDITAAWGAPIRGLANDMGLLLYNRYNDPNSGWQLLNPSQNGQPLHLDYVRALVQRYSDMGYLVVASFLNSESNEYGIRLPGHVAIVRPLPESLLHESRRVPVLATAGLHNDPYRMFNDVFRNERRDYVLFFLYRGGN